MILIENISKTFHDPKRDEIKAVDGISLRCNPGEIYGLLGPNGAGKTTLMRMIATILSPTSGTASVCGYDVIKQPQEVRSNIGYMSNSTALYERLTPRQVVSYFGELNGLSSDEIHRRIRTIFQRLEITDFADSRCDKLSTGQKQRVSIARTIVHEPKVLVFDEPTNGLDILASRVIIRFIKDCKAEGRTIIFSTHILSEIEEICDQIGIVYNGKLVASGTQSELQIQTGQTNLRNVFLSVMGAE